MSAQQSVEPKTGQEPARELLFSEHHVLLRSAELTRVINRVVLIGLVLFYLSCSSPSTMLNLGILATGALASAFWCLQEFTFRRNINRLQELVVEAYSQSLDKTGAVDQTVLLKPVEVTSHTDQAPELRRNDIWIDTYVKWRHERWVNARFELAQSLEAVAWLGLLIALVVARTLRL